MKSSHRRSLPMVTDDNYRTDTERLDDIERMLRVPRCDECKWWDEPVDDTNSPAWGVCGRIRGDGNKAGAVGIVGPAGGPHLCAVADFGCVQWEQKT